MYDVRHFIRVYDRTLDPVLCRRVIEAFEASPEHHATFERQFANGNEQSTARWAQMETAKSPALRDVEQALIERCGHFAQTYMADTDHQIFPFMLEGFKIKRYEPTAHGMFPPHVDVTHQGSMHRMVAALWYLNDVAEGGETWFGKLDVKVAPREGRLLMFPPIWMYPHAGLPPKSNRKYIVGTYLSYSKLDARPATD